MRSFTFAILAAALASAVSALDTIVIKDNHFYNSKTNEPFFIKGVDYQPGGSSGVEKGKDPLSDADACARDIFLFQQLGINTIRIYSIDPAINHDECMTLLAAAGIYLVLDVNSPLQNQHLHDLEPWTTYNEFYLKHIFQVIEAFSGYDNVLAFLAGNEVVHRAGSENTTPSYVKAIIRDMKGYIANHVHRAIPVGYSNADNIEFRVSLAEYLTCGNVGYVDYWAINTYTWCADADFDNSGYPELIEQFKNYSLPILFSEYGCVEVKPRKWNDVRALFSDKMTGIFSGGLVYEFTENKNGGYGLVNVAANGDVELTDEFEPLAKADKEAGPGKIPSNAQKNPRPTKCRGAENLPGITVLPTLPTQLPAIKSMIVDGLSTKDVNKGKWVDLDSLKLETTKKITDASGKEIKDKKIKVVEKITASSPPTTPINKDIGGGVGNKTPKDDPITGSTASSDGSSSGGSNDGSSDNNDDDTKGAAGSITAFTFGTTAMAAVAAFFLSL